MKPALIQPQFALGHIVATSAAVEAIEESGQTQDFFLDEHVQRDWGSLCREDQHANDQATRMLSAYKTLRGRWLWIITEADRSVTTIMLPTEY